MGNTAEPVQLKVEGATSQVDLMIRQTRIHHMTLSMVADQKANMLMIASSFVLTLAARDASSGSPHWYSLILVVSSLISVGVAILAAMPKLPFSMKKPQGSRNLLFFSYFTNLSYEQFVQEIETVIASPSKVYEMQLREIYELGMYLKHYKYRFIQIGYTIFLLGLIASAVAWLMQSGLG